MLRARRSRLAARAGHVSPSARASPDDPLFPRSSRVATCQPHRPDHHAPTNCQRASLVAYTATRSARSVQPYHPSGIVSACAASARASLPVVPALRHKTLASRYRSVFRVTCALPVSTAKPQCLALLAVPTRPRRTRRHHARLNHRRQIRLSEAARCRIRQSPRPTNPPRCVHVPAAQHHRDVALTLIRDVRCDVGLRDGAHEPRAEQRALRTARRDVVAANDEHGGTSERLQRLRGDLPTDAAARAGGDCAASASASSSSTSRRPHLRRPPHCLCSCRHP